MITMRTTKRSTAPFSAKQRRGLIEDFEKQDYNLVVETIIEHLRSGLRLDLSDPRGYVERLFMLFPVMKNQL